MAARNTRKREKFRPPDLADIQQLDASDFQAVDEWMPNWGRECEVCGHAPCVSDVYQGKVVYDGTMCGVCTWGEAACRDPANW